MKLTGIVLFFAIVIGVGAYIKGRWGTGAKLTCLGALLLLWLLLWQVGEYLERRAKRGDGDGGRNAEADETDSGPS